jgi:hypothetical protein
VLRAGPEPGGELEGSGLVVDRRGGDRPPGLGQFMDEEDSTAMNAIAETRYTGLTHELQRNLEAYR